MPEERPFLTVPEVATLLGRSTERTYLLVAAGKVPAVRIGKHIRIPRRAFNQWLDDLNASALASVGADRPTAA